MEPKNLGFMTDHSAEADYQVMKDAVMDEVKRSFKPEFINRVDEIIVFRSLEAEDAVQIADIILKEITDRAKEQMGIRITVTKKAKMLMVEQGFDKKYGARSLKRKIQSLMEDELAEEILAGRIKEGDKVRIDVKGGKLTFKAQATGSK